MAQIINTNIPSLNAQRNLAKTEMGLATTLQRLSTGLRINSAKDDAAGLAITERFTSQIKGLDQATRNANDGISLSQTAEAALSTVGDNLQRIRELAVQSANATNSAGDRRALDEEVQQLIAEVGRIAFNSEFNGEAILDGSKGTSFFQIGPNQGQMISITNMDSRTSRLGAQEAFPNGATDSVDRRFTQDALDLMRDTSVASLGISGTITITGQANTLLSVIGAGNEITVPSTGVLAANSLEEVVSAINNEIQNVIDVGDPKGQAVSQSGLKAFLRVDNAGRTGIVVTSNLNPDPPYTYNDSMFTVNGGTVNNTTTVVTSPAAGTTLFATNAAETKSLEELDILSRENASEAMSIVDGALNQINSLRAEMGAVQRRFETTIDNLRVGHESMSAARSRIRDADFAAETAELTRYQILQQAGISVLTQANAMPQQALSLLQ